MPLNYLHYYIPEFLQELRRHITSKEEDTFMEKTITQLRCDFADQKSLNGEERLKFVSTILYLSMRGKDVDFGHMEAVNLLASNKYKEKQIGYLFLSLLNGRQSDLLKNKSELQKLIVQRIRNELSSKNSFHVNLALQFISDMDTKEAVENFKSAVMKLLLSGDEVEVKDAAALCLVKFFRISPISFKQGEYADGLVQLLNDSHEGVVTSAASLIEALSKKWPEEYKGSVSLAVSRLSQIVAATDTDLNDYENYSVPAPWLCIKLLRLLQNYPPPDYPSNKARLIECLKGILDKVQDAPTSNEAHSNAKNAVLFEAIKLLIHMDMKPLLVRACDQLGKFLSHRDTNLRYMALEAMCRMAASQFTHTIIKEHQKATVKILLSEEDLTLRQKAVDLLSAMCDPQSLVYACDKVGIFLSHRTPFLRYLAFDSMCLLSRLDVTQDTVRKHLQKIIHNVRTVRDVSVRQKAVELIYAICDRSNANQIVAALLASLKTADNSICEEIVLKIADLMEKHKHVQLTDLDSMENLSNMVVVMHDFPGKGSLLRKLSQSRAEVEEMKRDEEELQANLSDVSQGFTPHVDLDLHTDNAGIRGDASDPSSAEESTDSDSDEDADTEELDDTDDVDDTSETHNKTDPSEFTIKNSAELWDYEYLQVKCNVETCKNLGKLSIIYINKSTQPFNKFTTSITWPRALVVQPNAQANSVDLFMDANTSISEMTNFVCVKEFKRTPVLHITFAFTNRAGKIKKFDKKCKLPVFVNFFSSTNNKTDKVMDANGHSKPVKSSAGETSARKKYIPPYSKYHTSYDRMVFEILEKEKNGLNMAQIYTFAKKNYQIGRNYQTCIKARVNAALHGTDRPQWINSSTGEMRGSLTLV